MLKAIIFDITGVLFPCQPWIGKYSDRPPREELLKIKQIVIDIYDKNKMSKKYLKENIFKADRPQNELEQIYKSLTEIDKDLFKLVKELSKKYNLYSIANEVEKWTDIRNDLCGFKKYFKKLFISTEIGMRKPDENIYQHFLSETKLKPNECLFIDDKNINIKAAKKLGFQTFTYTDFATFQRFVGAHLY